MSNEDDAPGAEFYYERLSRAQAVPEAERSPEVAAWLRSHAAIAAATSALPLAPDNGTLTQPLGGQAALAALLHFLVGCHTALPAHLQHPQANFRRMTPQLPPVAAVLFLNSKYAARWQPLLYSVLQDGLGSMGRPADLELVARLLLTASVCLDPGFEEPLVALLILESMEPALAGEAAAAQLAQQLARLEQQLVSDSGSSSGSGALPSVQQLREVWGSLSLNLLTWVDRSEVLPTDRVLQLAQRAAEALLALQRDNPRGSYELARIAMIRRWAATDAACQRREQLLWYLAQLVLTLSALAVPCCSSHSTGSNRGAHMREAVQHYLRCAEMARVQSSPYFLAR